MTAVGFALALGVGCVALCAAWVSALTARIAERNGQLALAREELARAAAREAQMQEALRGEAARRAALEASLEAERRAAEERAKVFEENRARLVESFQALSSDALRSNSEAFLREARLSMEKFQEAARGDLDQRHKAVADLVQPVREKLERFEGGIQQIEKERGAAYAGPGEGAARSDGQAQHRAALAVGARALGRDAPAPHRRAGGHVGPLRLRRAGHRPLRGRSAAPRPGGAAPGRPHRPGRRQGPHDRIPRRGRDVRRGCAGGQVRQHVTQLGRKTYWEAFEDSLELIVLFLPHDALFSAALEHDRELLEHALRYRVVLATPTTLAALLLTIAHGWKQEKLAINAREIANLGRDLHKRISDTARHLAKLGRQIDGTVRAYNEAVGSLESRVLPGARRFEELHAANVDVEVEALLPVETSPRPLLAPELTGKEVPEDAN
jgi:DNA recombination protein RmuC